MEKPLVTVITPCYNGEEFLHGYFEAILSQTYENIELIFVNDGSKDKTEEIALSYKEKLEARGIKYKYIYQENAGQAHAMNTGFVHMTGKYLAWPDSDDIISPESIQKRVEFLENNPEYGMVRTNGTFFDFDTKEFIRRISDDENRFNTDIFMDMILETTYCCCGCYMIKTECLREIYPDLTIMESYSGQNWQILIPMAGRHLCGYIDEDLYHIAQKQGSHSRQNLTPQKEEERRMELKRVLLDGIERSGRCDRDYKYIVDIKYKKIMFRIYTWAGDYKTAEKFYKQLKKEKQLDNEERTMYLSNGHPIGYFLHRAKGKIYRMLGK